MLRLVFSLRRIAKFLIFFSVCSMAVIGVSFALAKLPQSITTSELLGLSFFVMLMLAFVIDKSITKVFPDKPKHRVYL